MRAKEHDVAALVLRDTGIVDRLDRIRNIVRRQDRIAWEPGDEAFLHGGTLRKRNPKLEAPNPKQIQNPKHK
jgi:hypothetical protein